MQKFTCSLWSILLTVLLSTIPFSSFAQGNVPITKMEIEGFKLFYVGDLVTLNLEVQPNYATCKDFNWEASDPSIVSLNVWNGTECQVTGLKEGTCTLTVTSVEDDPVSISAEITVKAKDDPSLKPYIEITSLPSTMDIKESTRFYAEIYPKSKTYTSFSCTLSDPSVLEMTRWMGEGIGMAYGNITALKAGTCTITVTDDEDESIYATKTVTVPEPPKYIPGQDSSEKAEFVDPEEKNSVDMDFAGKSVTTDWADDDKVTALLKEYVTGIPDGAYFQGYRTNTDIKGYTHYDYHQMDATSGCKVDGCELLAHVDKDGNLVCLTGTLATAVGGTPYGLMYKLNPKKTVDLDLTTSAYTKQAELTGKLYYYSKGDKETASFNGASDANGTFALQDPGRVYTLDYSNSISKGYNVNGILESLPEALSYAEDFTSKTASLNEGYQGLASKVKSIKIYQIPYYEEGNEPTITLEIRKTQTAGFANAADAAEAWNNGTEVLKAQAKPQGNMVTFNINNLVIDVPNREQDPEGKAEDDLYFLEAYTETDTLISAELPKQHDSSLNGSVEIDRELVNKQPALNVHWGLERTLDVYKETFGLNSFDNQGSPVIALLNVGEPTNDNFDHITRDGCGVMKFGFGTFARFKGFYEVYNTLGLYPPLALEAMAHEFTHIVTNKLAPFYRDSYALSESYADIMGMMVRRKTIDNSYSFTTKGETISYENWYVGQIAGSGSPMFIMRRFDDPNIDSHPKYYKGEIWESMGEEGEPHADAGVQNHWFYLLCTGAKDYQPEQGEKVTITAIPRDSAELITFGSLMYFTTKYTDYPAARKNSIHMAEMYFGENSQEVQSVYSAWYAVGVGTDEWQPGMPTGVNAVYENSSLNTSVSAHKMLKNGRIVIKKDGKEYNAVGQQL